MANINESYPPLLRDVSRLLISSYYKNVYTNKPAMKQQEDGHE